MLTEIFAAFLTTLEYVFPDKNRGDVTFDSDSALHVGSSASTCRWAEAAREPEVVGDSMGVDLVRGESTSIGRNGPREDVNYLNKTQCASDCLTWQTA